MTREEFLYRMAKLVSYPTWIASFTIGILLIVGVVSGTSWIVTALILLGIAMPIGVKLSRMELAKTMLAVFEVGMIAERERQERIALERIRNEQGTDR